jgi:hypothetical protein
MSRPVIQGWIIENRHFDARNPTHLNITQGGFSAIPFFTDYDVAIRQREWLKQMYPDGDWIVTSAVITTEKET